MYFTKIAEKETKESNDHSEAFFRCKAYTHDGDIELKGDERVLTMRSTYKREEARSMSEESIRKFYETVARIISEREQVKVTVKVSRKEAAA